MEDPTEKLNCGTTGSCERCGKRNLQEYLPFGTDPLPHPHVLRGKEIIRRATVDVLAKNTVDDPGKIEYFLRVVCFYRVVVFA